MTIPPNDMDQNASEQINDGAIMERSYSFCNDAMRTIALQCRRLKTSEPEDSDFLFRKWADFRFLILSLDRLEKAVTLAKNISAIADDVDNALQVYRCSLPMLKKFRNVGEHIENYAMDNVLR